MTSAKRVVVHEDDVGMCHGANVAFAELTGLGICTAGSVMVPCPWFLEVAEMQAKNPRLDIGVHLTLTSEWKHYRWRPLTGASQASGLVDPDGYFWRNVAEVRARAHPEAVEAELRAQVEAARTAGIDITHVDTHMYTLLGPEFIDIYVRLGREERVPILLARNIDDDAGTRSGPAVEAAIAKADEAGLKVFDRILETLWQRGTSVEDDYSRLVDRITPGLTFMSLHFNAPGELESIVPDLAFIRTEELALFKSEKFRARLTSGEFELIGFRGLRDEWEQADDAPPYCVPHGEELGGSPSLEPHGHRKPLTLATENRCHDDSPRMCCVAEIIPFRSRLEHDDGEADIDLLTAVDVAIRDLRDITRRWGDDAALKQAEECRLMLERAFNAAV